MKQNGQTLDEVIVEVEAAGKKWWEKRKCVRETSWRKEEVLEASLKMSLQPVRRAHLQDAEVMKEIAPLHNLFPTYSRGRTYESFFASIVFSSRRSLSYRKIPFLLNSIVHRVIFPWNQPNRLAGLCYACHQHIPSPLKLV